MLGICLGHILDMFPNMSSGGRSLWGPYSNTYKLETLDGIATPGAIEMKKSKDRPKLQSRLPLHTSSSHHAGNAKHLQRSSWTKLGLCIQDKTPKYDPIKETGPKKNVSSIACIQCCLTCIMFVWSLLCPSTALALTLGSACCPPWSSGNPHQSRANFI